MDEKLINQLLNEDIPEWSENDFKDSDDLLNEDTLSVCTELNNDDDGTNASKANSRPTLTQKGSYLHHDVFSISSATGITPLMSPNVAKKLDQSPEKQTDLFTNKIIRLSTLNKIRNQMTSVKVSEPGEATCCTRGKYLAVGTSRGLVFLFDMKQILRLCVSSEEKGAKFGGVTCLSFNVDSSRLLVAFERSHIDMWDISNETTPRLLRSIDNCQNTGGMGYAISNLKFLEDPARAVYVDTQGSVFQLSFKRGIYGRTTDSDCFFSGSRGEILCIEPLLFHPSTIYQNSSSNTNSITNSSNQSYESLINDYALLAMVSFTKVIVLASKPILKVMFMHPLKGSATTLPQITWSIHGRTGYAMLTFARDSSVSMVTVSLNGTAAGSSNNSNNAVKLKFSVISQFNVPFQIISVKWMNLHCMGLIDTSETFHLLDSVSQRVLQSVDLRPQRLNYNTSLFKSSATGGYVSEAMKVAAERACYHTVVGDSVCNMAKSDVDLGCQLKLIGAEEKVCIIMLRNWDEMLKVPSGISDKYTVTYLQNLMRFCARIYRSPSEPAATIESRFILGLPREYLPCNQGNKTKSTIGKPIVARHEMIQKRSVELIEASVEIVAFQIESGNQGDAGGNKSSLSSVAMDSFMKSIRDLCTATEQMSFFIEPLYRLINQYTHYKETSPLATVYSQHMIGLLLSTVQPITQQLHPEVVRSLVEHLLSVHHFNELDNLLAKLPVQSIDLDFVTRISKEHHLFSALIHVYNDAFLDYLTPLKVIIEFIGQPEFLTFHPDSRIEMVNTAINYIHSCLTTSTQSEDDNRQQIIFDCLTTNQNECMKLLNQYNCSDMLNMLSLVFEGGFFQDAEFGASRKQAILQRLCELFCDNQKGEHAVHLLVFLSRELVRPPNPTYIDTDLLFTLIESACLVAATSNSVVTRLHGDLENAVLGLTEARIITSSNRECAERILTLAKQARLFRVCQRLYREQGMHEMVLESYLLDPSVSIETSFQYFESVWLDDSIDKAQRDTIANKCLELANSLVSGSPVLAVVILLSVCGYSQQDVSNVLQQDKNQLELQFLVGLFCIRGEIRAPVFLSETDRCLVEGIGEDVLMDVRVKSGLVEAEGAHTFVELLLRRCSCVSGGETELDDGSLLHEFLNGAARTRCYNVERVCVLLRDHIKRGGGDGDGQRAVCVTGCICLAELLQSRMRKYEDAAGVYLMLLQAQWRQTQDLEVTSDNDNDDQASRKQQDKIDDLRGFSSYMDNGKDSKKCSRARDECWRIVRLMVTLIGRCKDPALHPKLWKPMLQWILKMFWASSENTENFSKEMKAGELMGQFVKEISTVVPLATIMSEVLRSPDCRSQSYGRVRAMLESVTERYVFEKEVLLSSERCIASDTMRGVVQDILQCGGRGRIADSVTGTLCVRSEQNCDCDSSQITATDQGGGKTLVYCSSGRIHKPLHKPGEFSNNDDANELMQSPSRTKHTMATVARPDSPPLSRKQSPSSVTLKLKAPSYLCNFKAYNTTS